MEIIHRYSKVVLYSRATATTIAEAIIEAVKGGANLGGADLGGANLGGANLGGANLGGANLGDADLGGADLDRWSIVIIGSRHVITAYADRISIGCHTRTIEKWLANYKSTGKMEDYTDTEIAEYGGHLRRIQAVMNAMAQEATSGSVGSESNAITKRS